MLNILHDDAVNMEQTTIAQTLKQNNARAVAKLVMVMAIIMTIALVVNLFPTMITVMFLMAPAIIMNVGWLFFSSAIGA